jgi:hypothetical protein
VRGSRAGRRRRGRRPHLRLRGVGGRSACRGARGPHPGWG